MKSEFPSSSQRVSLATDTPVHNATGEAQSLNQAPALSPVDAPDRSGLEGPKSAPLDAAFESQQIRATAERAKLKTLAALFPQAKRVDTSVQVTDSQLRVFASAAESYHLSADPAARDKLSKSDTWRSNRADYSFERDVINRLLSIAPQDEAIRQLAAMSDKELADALPQGIASSTVGSKMAAALGGRVVETTREVTDPSDASAYRGIAISSAPAQFRINQPLTGVAPGSIQLVDQGFSNACGTSSLSMAMRYFQGATADNLILGIDDDIRATAPIDAFTAPRDIVDYANEHNLRATVRDDSNLAEVRAMVDQGVPCITLTDWNFANGRARPNGVLHFVVVTGFESHANPITGESEEYVVVANPWGRRDVVLASEFDVAWRGARADGHVMPAGAMDVPLPFRRLMVPMIPESGPVTLPDGSQINADDVELVGSKDGDGSAGWLASFVSSVLRVLNKMINAVTDIFKKNPKTLASIRQDVVGASINKRAKIVERLSTSSVHDHRDLIAEVLNSVDAGDEVALARRLDLEDLAENLEADEAQQLSTWLLSLGAPGEDLAQRFASARAMHAEP